MGTCATSGCHALPPPEPRTRVLRWTFRRNDDAIVCELGLNADELAYELRLDPPVNPFGIARELFDDALSAFDRHTAIERRLVDEGWLLEAFESTLVAR
jgi:hypothetical protein